MLISEVFGRHVKDQSDEAKDLRNRKQCPFKNIACTKSRNRAAAIGAVDRSCAVESDKAADIGASSGSGDAAKAISIVDEAVS